MGVNAVGMSTPPWRLLSAKLEIAELKSILFLKKWYIFYEGRGRGVENCRRGGGRGVKIEATEGGDPRIL
jgi:hypothetical protein